ncbi:MAG: hypothetical protein HZC55_01295 [Verrucomicrobia bacterium]|nr:hypothetical protein [Verrucomicrobiota bacterium]
MKTALASLLLASGTVVAMDPGTHHQRGNTALAASAAEPVSPATAATPATKAPPSTKPTASLPPASSRRRDSSSTPKRPAHLFM